MLKVQVNGNVSDLLKKTRQNVHSVILQREDDMCESRLSAESDFFKEFQGKNYNVVM